MAPGGSAAATPPQGGSDEQGPQGLKKEWEPESSLPPAHLQPETVIHRP